MTEMIGVPKWVIMGYLSNNWYGRGTLQIREDGGSPQMTEMIGMPKKRDGLLTMTAATHTHKDPHNCNESNYYWPSSQLRSTAWLRLRQCNEALLKQFDLWEVTKAKWTVTQREEGGRTTLSILAAWGSRGRNTGFKGVQQTCLRCVWMRGPPWKPH